MQPALNSLMDDHAAAQASLEKLKRLNVKDCRSWIRSTVSLDQAKEGIDC
jgi:hypothetical protein